MFNILILLIHSWRVITLQSDMPRLQITNGLLPEPKTILVKRISFIIYASVPDTVRVSGNTFEALLLLRLSETLPKRFLPALKPEPWLPHHCGRKKPFCEKLANQSLAQTVPSDGCWELAQQIQTESGLKTADLISRKNPTTIISWFVF